MAQRTIFCDSEQTPTLHNLAVDPNNEILLTCTTEGCGHFVKYPAGMEIADIKEDLKKYEVANNGKVMAAELEAQRAVEEEKLAGLADDVE